MDPFQTLYPVSITFNCQIKRKSSFSPLGLEGWWIGGAGLRSVVASGYIG